MIDYIFDHIVETTCGDDIHEEIQDMKHEYVDDDWSEEFEDFEEAYCETGRCAAESEVVNSLVRAAGVKLGIGELDMITHCAVFDMVVEQFDIEQDN